MLPPIRNERAAVAFATQLFKVWPGFAPTRTMYLDFEGSGSDEQILSLFWPRLKKSDRFEMLWRGWDDQGMDSDSLANVLNILDCDHRAVEWIGVFSAGQPIPDEQLRFEHQFGGGWFPNAEWVNFHWLLRNCRPLRRQVTSTAWARNLKDKSQIRLSLENLEYEFGIVRPVTLRSHSNVYADGRQGGMSPLESEQTAYHGEGESAEEFELLEHYCYMDVESLFRIARRCSRLAE